MNVTAASFCQKSEEVESFSSLCLIYLTPVFMNGLRKAWSRSYHDTSKLFSNRQIGLPNLDKGTAVLPNCWYLFTSRPLWEPQNPRWQGDCLAWRCLAWRCLVGRCLAWRCLVGRIKMRDLFTSDATGWRISPPRLKTAEDLNNYTLIQHHIKNSTSILVRGPL